MTSLVLTLARGEGEKLVRFIKRIPVRDIDGVLAEVGRTGGTLDGYATKVAAGKGWLGGPSPVALLSVEVDTECALTGKCDE